MGENNEIQELSLGEERVRTEFNPSKKDKVSQIKQKSAELINLIQKLRENESLEVQRLVDLAENSYEEAAMWAVKAATA